MSSHTVEWKDGDNGPYRQDHPTAEAAEEHAADVGGKVLKPKATPAAPKPARKPAPKKSAPKKETTSNKTVVTPADKATGANAE